MTTDLAQYEALLADWREKEDHAERMREFRDTGGEHRLKLAAVNADPALAAIVAPFLNGLMKGAGWSKVVEMGVERAERDAERARMAHEAAAIASSRMRVVQ